MLGRCYVGIQSRMFELFMNAYENWTLYVFYSSLSLFGSRKNIQPHLFVCVGCVIPSPSFLMQMFRCRVMGNASSSIRSLSLTSWKKTNTCYSAPISSSSMQPMDGTATRSFQSHTRNTFRPITFSSSSLSSSSSFSSSPSSCRRSFSCLMTFLSSSPEIIDTAAVMSDTLSVAASATSSAVPSSPPPPPSDMWFTTRYLINYLEYIRTTTSLPWWQCIMLGTIGVRVMMVPVGILAQKNGERLAKAKVEMESVTNEFRNRSMMYSSVGQRIPMSEIQEHQVKMGEVRKKYGFKMSHTFLPLTMAPIFMSFFFGLRRMAEIHPDLAQGGISWVTNLTIPDPYFILPILNASVIFLTIRMGADGMTSMNKMVQNVLIGLTLLAIPTMGSTMPASLFFYWITSSTFACIQSYLLRRDWLRKALGMATMKELKAIHAGNAAHAASQPQKSGLQGLLQKLSAADHPNSSFPPSKVVDTTAAEVKRMHPPPSSAPTEFAPPKKNQRRK